MKGRKLLMIPGPIEFEPDVLQALGAPTDSHVSADFIEIFGNSLELMRTVWQSPTGQPFIMAGSGTLAMDMAAVNLIEPNDNVLIISTGYFGERYANICKRYGANVTILTTEVGDTVSLNTIEEELSSKKYKLLTITHVDTSTSVLVDPEPIAKLAKKYDTLSILDGVCSVAGEEIKQDKWGIDVVFTASQKAIGVPPGLALLMVSEKAMNVFKNRKTLVQNYYADFTNWLPIMEAYENRNPSYFGTPSVNLISALEVSLQYIVSEGIENRFLRHKQIATAFREAMLALGLQLLPFQKDISANTLTAIYYPENIDGGTFLKHIGNNDIILAGGLLPSHKTQYFRVGHMGSVNNNDTLATISAIESSLIACNYAFETGIGVKTALKILNS
ncbi:MAG: alanine--glyoxylate aminotransferase family protein [Lutibacter sp.]|uniref:pyridoxal-phosphate-dependent aminotransferase family protein n=1 Tax=Lutibacter sp. TaxID=1925666 RepID=UPI0017936CF5|nr:alanine--glyoxylate aminotransferase family protein [Lutibacter sp.]MBT8316081.1 alanine--glyoxylate aminotransferase family protein [Lutibacter sp.]NNJ56940.1 alanine--glyoxylate aminotransferase family protein [Lutibacter sp.]